MKAADKIDAEHQPVLGVFPNYRQITDMSREGKSWDFKWQRSYLDPSYLYMMNETAQQYDVAGNAMWAAGMKQIGVPELTARLGAQGYSMWSDHKLDDPRDQFGIKYGYQPKLSAEVIDFDVNSLSSAANGGFVIYPNKANLNMTRAVYSK